MKFLCFAMGVTLGTLVTIMFPCVTGLIFEFAFACTVIWAGCEIINIMG